MTIPLPRRPSGHLTLLVVSLGCILCLFVSGSSAHAAVTTDPGIPEKVVILVRDAPADNSTLKNFRTSDMIMERICNENRSTIEKNTTGTNHMITAITSTNQITWIHSINTSGLDTLHASGSGEFSEASLIWLKQQLGGNVTIVDLRQESHGFFNGAPITWYAENDWGNIGKTHDETLQDERVRLAALTLNTTTILFDAQAVKSGTPDTGTEIKTSVVYSEQELAEHYGIRYYRLTVTDHMQPGDEDVDRFIAFTRTLDNDNWLHFHCRAGEGRTTTFLAMYDMLKNADRVSLEDIIARQATVSPYYDLFSWNPESPRAELYRNRAEFLRNFYKYARAFRAGDTANWSEWRIRTTGNAASHRCDIRNVFSSPDPSCTGTAILTRSIIILKTLPGTVLPG